MVRREYTLYFDESGTFEMDCPNGPNDPWIVGGFLIEGSNRVVTESLESILLELISSLTRESWFPDLHSFVKWQVDENRKLPKTVRDVYKQLLNLEDRPLGLHRVSFTMGLRRAFKDESSKLIYELDASVRSVLASTKSPHRLVIGVHRSRPTTFDPTNYSMLVQDFIGQVFSEVKLSLGEESSATIKLRIARRRYKDLQKHTRRLVPHELKIAVANGLVAAGSHDLLSRDSDAIEIDAAESSAGLVISDFICGHCRDVLLSMKYVDAIATLGEIGVTVYAFEDSPEKKRAQIAEQSGDYVQAICTKLTGNPIVDEEIVGLLTKLLGTTNQMAARLGLESLIESMDKFSKNVGIKTFMGGLRCIESSLEDILHRGRHDSIVSPNSEALLFRFRSYYLGWANHVGDSTLGTSIENQLGEAVMRVRSDPLAQEAIFQYEVGLVEAAINDHRFEEALSLAENHSRTVRSFDSVDGKEGQDMGAPQHYLNRSWTVELRAGALAASAKANFESVESYQELALDSYTELIGRKAADITTFEDDLVRLLQVESFVAEVLGDIEALKSISSRLVELLSENQNDAPYSSALLLRNCSTLALLGFDMTELDTTTMETCEEHVQRTFSCRIGKHPQEIIMREALLFSFLTKSLTESDLQFASDSIMAWLDSTGNGSRVLVHQASLARLILDYTKGVRSTPALSEAGQLRAARLETILGIGRPESEMLAARSETIY